LNDMIEKLGLFVFGTQWEVKGGKKRVMVG
jgi:hypothetical protein